MGIISIAFFRIMEPSEFECPWPAGAVDLCFVMESEKDKELSITPLVTLIF